MGFQQGWVELPLGDLSGSTTVNLDAIAEKRTAGSAGRTRLIGPGIDVEVYVPYQRLQVVNGRLAVVVDDRPLDERVLEAVVEHDRLHKPIGRRGIARVLGRRLGADGRAETVTQWQVRTACQKLETDGAIEHNGVTGPGGGYQLTQSYRETQK